MKLTHFLASTVSIASLTLFAGCAMSKTKAAPSTPISAEQLDMLRAEFAKADASTRLGAVIETIPASEYVRLGSIVAADFPIGTAVGIIDSNRNTIATGEVVQVDGDHADVHYAQTGVRAPMVGDVGIRFADGK